MTESKVEFVKKQKYSNLEILYSHDMVVLVIPLSYSEIDITILHFWILKLPMSSRAGESGYISVSNEKKTFLNIRVALISIVPVLVGLVALIFWVLVDIKWQWLVNYEPKSLQTDAVPNSS